MTSAVKTQEARASAQTDPRYIDREGRSHRVTVKPYRRCWRIHDRQGRKAVLVDEITNAPDSERLAHGVADDYARQKRREFGNPEPDDDAREASPTA